MTQTLYGRPTAISRSADVRMELHIAGQVLRPCQTAQNWIMFDETVLIAPGNAQLRLIIDGVVQESIIRILPQASPGKRIPVQILQLAQVI